MAKKTSSFSGVHGLKNQRHGWACQAVLGSYLVAKWQRRNLPTARSLLTRSCMYTFSLYLYFPCPHTYGTKALGAAPALYLCCLWRWRTLVVTCNAKKCREEEEGCKQGIWCCTDIMCTYTWNSYAYKPPSMFWATWVLKTCLLKPSVSRLLILWEERRRGAWMIKP
jgi:hypothetical protein